MSLKTRLLAVVGGLAAFMLTGCGPIETPKDVGDISGVEEIGQPPHGHALVKFHQAELHEAYHRRAQEPKMLALDHEVDDRAFLSHAF